MRCHKNLENARFLPYQKTMFGVFLLSIELKIGSCLWFEQRKRFNCCGYRTFLVDVQNKIKVVGRLLGRPFNVLWNISFGLEADFDFILDVLTSKRTRIWT